MVVVRIGDGGCEDNDWGDGCEDYDCDGGYEDNEDCGDASREDNEVW